MQGQRHRELLRFAINAYTKERARVLQVLEPLEQGAITHWTQQPDGSYAEVTAEVIKERREMVTLYDALISLYKADLEGLDNATEHS